MSRGGHHHDHGSRLTRVEAAISVLQRGQEATSAKLDAIANALHDMRASRPTDWREMLTVVREGAMLFALLVGGILYLATGSKSDALHALDKRVQAVELRTPASK
jgi:hypothetical protein